jgi:hypothetical protein
MTDAREITVEDIDAFERWCIDGHGSIEHWQAICALARRALSQAGGERRNDHWPRIPSECDHPHWRCPFCGTRSTSPPVSVEREREEPHDDCGDPGCCPDNPDTPQSVPTCTCSKHPLWDGYDGDCPIHGWFEPVAPDTPQSVPAEEITIEGERYRWNKSEKLWVICTPDAPLSQGEELADYLEHMTDREIGSSRDREKLSEAAALIASLIAERDKLTRSAEGFRAAYLNAFAENAKLVERVSVLEKALEKIERNVTGDIRVVIEIARAALRTSEDAK